MDEKTVLIVGGGVAALAAAMALIEQNENRRSDCPRFKITIATSDDIWGGRASSWPGGAVRPSQETDGSLPDFSLWPRELPLNHGFHAVFDQTTYVNFWRTLALAGLTPEKLIGSELISNDHEILVFESETMKVCRLPIRNLPFPLSLIPFNHLAFAALELWIHGEAGRSRRSRASGCA